MDYMIFLVTSPSFVYDFFRLVCQELLPKFQISCIISVDKKKGYFKLTAEVEIMNTVTYGQVQTLVRQIPAFRTAAQNGRTSARVNRSLSRANRRATGLASRGFL